MNNKKIVVIITLIVIIMIITISRAMVKKFENIYNVEQNIIMPFVEI